MRKFINRYGSIIAVVAALVVVIVWWSSRHKTQSNAPTQAYYVDEETGDETIRDAAIPPLIGKSGRPTVVQAVKYSCDGGKTRTTLYLRKYAGDGEIDPKSPDADLRRQQRLTTGELVRSPVAGSKWVPATSEEGQALSVIPLCPNGGHGEIVFP